MPKGKSNPLRLKRSYTLRELSPRNHTKVLNYFKDIEGNSDALNSLKKPGELWYFTLFGNRSILFDDINLAAQKANEWAMSSQKPSHGSQTDEALIHGVKFAKFGKGAKNVNVETESDQEKIESIFEQEKNVLRRKAIEKKNQLIQTAQKELTPKGQRKQKLGVSGLLAKAMEQRAALQAQQAELKKQIDRQRKQLAKLRAQLKPAKKSSKSKSKTKKGN